MKDLAILYKNRAAVHLRMQNFRLAVEDCTKSLENVRERELLESCLTQKCYSNKFLFVGPR